MDDFQITFLLGFLFIFLVLSLGPFISDRVHSLFHSHSR